MRQSKKGKMFSEKRSGSKQIWKEFEIDFKRIWSDLKPFEAILKQICEYKKRKVTLSPQLILSLLKNPQNRSVENWLITYHYY